MAFRDLEEGLDLPKGATPRFRRMTALERMLDGTIYDDLAFSFETEKYNDKHIPLRERRPSVDFNLAYEITQDTLAELFGDEQFPIISVMKKGEHLDDAASAVADLIESQKLDEVMTQAYEDGVVGSVYIVLQKSGSGKPFFDILPGKWCEPIYAKAAPDIMLALMVTLPIDRKSAIELYPPLQEDDDAKAVETFWFRYVIDAEKNARFIPLPDYKFAKLGERDGKGEPIEFKPLDEIAHGLTGRVPVVCAKNLGGKAREADGPALWWPIRNITVELDYTLSQAGRGLRYTADPMLFVRKGDLSALDDLPAGYERPAGGMSTLEDEGGAMVKGATQTLVGGPGSDAKLLEITAKGIEEEREFARDLREYALEVIGGMKARAEHMKGAPSGVAIDKAHKPLRRVVRRQRRPYGRGLLLDLINLLLWATRKGYFESDDLDFDVAAIPEDSKTVCNWPNDEVLQGSELLAHVTGIQLSAGGSATDPKELISPEAAGKKLVADMGYHEPYDTIKGSGEQKPPDPTPEPAKPAIAKP